MKTHYFNGNLGGQQLKHSSLRGFVRGGLLTGRLRLTLSMHTAKQREELGVFITPVSTLFYL